MIKIGIIGGAGYTAGELIRLLVNHPEADIRFIHSSSNAGKAVTDVHAGLYGDTDLTFSPNYDFEDIDVLFLCVGHGDSSRFLASNHIPASVRIIDLAQDFRDESDGFVYALPELNRDRIADASKVANPGCFATAIQLALLPAVKAGIIDGEINVTALTGSTGAGVKPSPTTHFSYRDNNISSYKEFNHQHLREIRRNLALLGGKECDAINFVPLRGDFTRGIFASVYFHTGLDADSIAGIYKNYYADATMTHYVDKPIDLKQVVNTSKALVHAELYDGGILHVVSVIDNLLKGASGQAVQNMNIMFGLPEKTGLALKASAF